MFSCFWLLACCSVAKCRTVTIKNSSLGSISAVLINLLNDLKNQGQGKGPWHRHTSCISTDVAEPLSLGWISARRHVGFGVEAVGGVHFGSRCERSVGFRGHLQEMASAVSRTTNSRSPFSLLSKTCPFDRRACVALKWLLFNEIVTLVFSRSWLYKYCSIVRLGTVFIVSKLEKHVCEKV